MRVYMRACAPAGARVSSPDTTAGIGVSVHLLRDRRDPASLLPNVCSVWWHLRAAPRAGLFPLFSRGAWGCGRNHLQPRSDSEGPCRCVLPCVFWFADRGLDAACGGLCVPRWWWERDGRGLPAGPWWIQMVCALLYCRRALVATVLPLGFCSLISRRRRAHVALTCGTCGQPSRLRTICAQRSLFSAPWRLLLPYFSQPSTRRHARGQGRVQRKYTKGSG